MSTVDDPLGSRVHVATGSIAAMIPAAAGSWELDFWVAGVIVLDVAGDPDP
jgi:hypothetical protein